jgi:hypothetical protein
MPYLKHMVGFINTTLEESLLQDACFDNRKVIGLAQIIPRQTREGVQLFPSYINNDGEGCDVTPDDSYDLIIYHRVNGILVSKSQMQSFGDDRKADVNTARMCLVAFGRRDRLRMTNDELAILLQASMPDALPKQLQQDLQFNTGLISINDIILNDPQAFQEEFPSMDYFLKPDQFLLKINYSIESSFLKGCFTNRSSSS